MSAAAATLLLAPSTALSAPDRLHRFSIPAEPVSVALIEFALQSDISLGGAQRCAGRTRPLIGDFSVNAGLAQLLAATSCDFKKVAPHTYLIVARARTAAAPVALARPAPDVVAADNAPSEVIVTATKRRAVADQLPYAISVIGVNALQAAGARDVSDLAAELAGVTTTNLGPGRDKILLRGLSDGTFTGRTQSTVGIYLDDTPITYNAPDPDLRLTDVQRVEFLRGPQGSLYGGGSMSGIYRIVTRKPELNSFSGDVLLGGALTENAAASGEFEAVLNLPLMRDRAALRLVAYGQDDGGYIDNVALRASNVDGATRVGGRAALELVVDPDWTLTAGGAIQQIHDNDTQYVSPSLGRLHRANAIREASENRFGEAYVTLERDGFGSDFKSSTSIVRHELSSLTDASNALPLFGLTTARVGAYDEPISITMLTEDAVLSSQGVGPLQWLVGAFGSLTWEGTQSTVSTGADATGPSLDLYHERRTDRLGEVALYGEASYAISDRLTGTAGLRAAGSTVSTTSDVEAPQSGAQRLFAGTDSSGGLSPKLALEFQASDTVRLYALVSEARRAGGFNTGGPIGTVFSTSAAAPGEHRRFSPDELWDFETGIKTNLFDGRLRLRSTLFYNAWSNIQTDQFLISGLSYTANAGDGLNFGSETEASFQPDEHIVLEANALFDHPELTHPSPGFVSVANVGLPGVPDLSAGARAAYRWTLGGGLAASLSAEAQYIGRSHITFESAQSPPMGGYVLDRVSAQIDGGKWRLSVYVLNVTNERGNTFSYGNPFNFRQISEVTPQRPRTVRITLGVDF